MGFGTGISNEGSIFCFHTNPLFSLDPMSSPTWGGRNRIVPRLRQSPEEADVETPATSFPQGFQTDRTVP
ncbi:hypothetical protein NPIL_485311 [Nephila pilipes]|uniref:Uncharacterized protein n=1 Tax=Nephila pilipes TaxID=299642 RepID=A0A8X6PTS7_NEPPI|nr:hypothetical protein NPIL_48611 [Nephila pilipes]GFS96204.1 hypothetical protein NPIL_154571 [Nephila pilipes]GFT79359.1 hypothetical protein NPIL_258001 [Nephila pilipes]GFT88497.1 hypothetical protein NPIL_485311 [Nephila pilipes]